MKGLIVLSGLLVLAIALAGCTKEINPLGVAKTPNLGEEGGMQIQMPGEEEDELLEGQLEDYSLSLSDIRPGYSKMSGPGTGYVDLEQVQGCMVTKQLAISSGWQSSYATLFQKEEMIENATGTSQELSTIIHAMEKYDSIQGARRSFAASNQAAEKEHQMSENPEIGEESFAYTESEIMPLSKVTYNKKRIYFRTKNIVHSIKISKPSPEDLSQELLTYADKVVAKTGE